MFDSRVIVWLCLTILWVWCLNDNEINGLHERALRITYSDNSSSFQNLLKKDNLVSIHHKNIQALASEMFKVENNIALEIMQELFASKISRYDLRNN